MFDALKFGMTKYDATMKTMNKEIKRVRYIYIQRDRQTQRERLRDRQRDGRESDRQRERQIERERERERDSWIT